MPINGYIVLWFLNVFPDRDELFPRMAFLAFEENFNKYIHGIKYIGKYPKYIKDENNPIAGI